MDQKLLQILVTLVFYHRAASAADATVLRDGQPHDIYCKPPETGGMVIWFRLVDRSGLEFIASFSRDGTKKSAAPLPPGFSDSKMSGGVLTLESFSGARDSGVYGCASIKSNELRFGEARRLVGVSAATPAPPVPPASRAPRGTAAQPRPSTTGRPCTCVGGSVTAGASPLRCAPAVLGPLAGACGLLLLLLIVATLYCHKIRTRRCPHHYKRRPRTMAPGKQMMSNRHV